MALFRRPSDELLKNYRDKALVITPNDPLPILFEAVTLSSVHPQVRPNSVKTKRFDRGLLAARAHAKEADLSIPCVSDQVPTSIAPTDAGYVDVLLPPLETRQARVLAAEDARIRQVALLSPFDCNLRTVDLANFELQIKRFEFASAREEGPTLFSQHKSARTTIRVAPIAPPDPPPTPKAENLHERLRQLLTPPIHELLSDPQLALPERPFPYQAYGIKWLLDREGALLADEMGLGKTMQAIIAARILWRDRAIRQVLIVCPKSLVQNWRRELRAWWPSISDFTLVVDRDREWSLRLTTENIAVKIINIESLPVELDWLKKNPPHHDLVILDEAQRIKNPKSKSAQAVKALQASRRWALTGTPLENSVKDLVSVFGFVRPGLIRETDSAAAIRTAIKPYVLRRRQDEVLKDLPELREQDVEIELGASQREAYDQAEREGVIKLNEKGDTVNVTHVLALINELRKICNFDPASGASAKTEFVLEELEEIVESGRKALIFNEFVSKEFGLQRVAKLISEAKNFGKQVLPLEISGQISPQARELAVRQFEKDPNRHVLMLNYKVGGIGLNLQVANYVFLFDRWWNPAVEAQAVKRCHRLGQTQGVLAQRLYCKGTIEERILRKLAEKRRLFTQFVDEDRPTVTLGLTEDEIFSLFDLTVQPRRRTPAPSRPRVVLDNLSHKAFEELVALIYEHEGYKVQITGKSHDGGIDLLAERATASGKDRVVVQCKHQKGNVGSPVVRELWGVLNSDTSLTRCALATTAHFTAEAKGFAAGKRIVLIDRKALQELASRHGIAEFVDSPSSR